MRKEYKTLSKTSPKGSAKGCLCKGSNTYSRKCCDGSLWAQGVGKIYGESLQTVWYGYEIEDCDDKHKHHVHVHDTPLEVGKVYYFTLENGHTGCHEVMKQLGGEGIHVESVSSAYSNCTDCQVEN